MSILHTLCPEFAIPYLQKLLSIKDIALFNYYKSTTKLSSDKVLLIAVSKNVLCSNLLFIYNQLKNTDKKVDVLLEADLKDRKKLFKLMAQAKYIVIDDYAKFIYPLTMRHGAKLIQVWHSTGAFKTMGFARTGKKGGGARTSLAHKNYTDVIVSSKQVTDDFEKAFMVKRSCIHPLGVARTDVFFDEQYINNTKEALRAKYNNFNNKKVVLFAPTYRGETRQTAHYPESYINIEAMAKELSDEYVIILKLHPFIKNSITIPEKFKDFVMDLSDYQDINDLLFITDVLVTDYSSVIFEYAFLKKPIVFYAPDLEEYIRERDFFYEYSSYIYGALAKDINELTSCIKSCVVLEEKLEMFYNKFLGACDGSSTKRFVDKIILE